MPPAKLKLDSEYSAIYGDYWLYCGQFFVCDNRSYRLALFNLQLRNDTGSFEENEDDAWKRIWWWTWGDSTNSTRGLLSDNY